MPARWCAAAAFLALLALRVAYAWAYRVDSDEPQHLHVVWGWTRGLLPYRDQFDNHSPLFQMLCSPLMRLLGERADILVPMRLAMLPLYFFDLWCVFRIGARLWNARAGLAAALLTALCPVFFFTSVEFRTDDLWVALWLLSLMIAVEGNWNGRRAFWTGLVLGGAFAVSMKTSLLLGAAVLAGICALGLRAKFRGRFSLGPLARTAPLLVAGMVIVPAALVLFFAVEHALPQMRYCVIEHNTLPGLGKPGGRGLRALLFPGSTPVLLALAGWIFFREKDAALAGRRVLILLTGAFATTALRSYWPLITRQDYLPIAPLLILGAVPLLEAASAKIAGIAPRWRHLPLGLLLTAELALILGMRSFMHNDVRPFGQQLESVLSLVGPDEFVMDAKGETIFRRRALYWVLEGITRERIRRGLIPYDVPQRLAETGTGVVVASRLSPSDLNFIQANYLLFSKRVFVAGKFCLPAGGPVSISIPGRYTLVADGPPPEGATLDGSPLSAGQYIGAGEHALAVPGSSGTSHDGGRLALVWSRAAAQGYSPFRK